MEEAFIHICKHIFLYNLNIALQATSDLEHYDKARHEEFKKYEMMKEHERREYLKTLSEEKRKEEESKFAEMKKKHENHPKVNHPVRTVTLPLADSC